MFKAVVSEILGSNGVNLVKFHADFAEISMICLEISSEIKIGAEVFLNFKSTDVILSRQKLVGVGILNEIEAEILAVKSGEILAVVSLKSGEFCFESLISKTALNALNLELGEKIFAYIKESSIFIEK